MTDPKRPVMHGIVKPPYNCALCWDVDEPHFTGKYNHLPQRWGQQ